MRAHPSTLAAALVLFASASSLSGRASRFEGVWKNIGEHVVTPDSNYDLPPLTVLHEKTFIMHIIEAAQPELVGQSLTREYRFRGDTLLIVDTEPWPKDKTKVSRSTLMFVGVPPK